MVFSGHRPRKSFGQHWLNDELILDKILDAAEINSEDRVLEIGPGKGSLTSKLLSSKANSVHAVEIDRDLISGLRTRFSAFTNFSIEQGDVLSIPLTFNDGLPGNKVVANIPYNITSPILERLLGGLTKPSEHIYDSLVLLVQQEVADRILAAPGDSSFSAFSVRIQLIARCSEVCTVNPKSFYPPPKVYSKVIVIKPLKSKHHYAEYKRINLESVLNVAFNARRKKLRNTLISLCPIDLLKDLSNDIGISLDQRPQELSPKQWVSLSKGITLINQSI